MKFQPQTEEEVLKDQMCPEGLQPFTVMEAVVVESKSEKNAGKEMLKLKLNVHASDGYDYRVYDYVAPWFMPHKFRHFFFAINCGADYEAGTVNVENIKDRTGWADIFIQKAKGNFPPKEAVRDYTAQRNEAPAAPGAAKQAAAEIEAKVKENKEQAPMEDDVPF